MVKVVWFVQGEDDAVAESTFPTATDLLQALDLVDIVTLESQEYKVVDKELVVDDVPYIAVLLEA